MLPIPSRRVYTTFYERALQALCIEYVILISRVVPDRYPCLLLAVAELHELLMRSGRTSPRRVKAFVASLAFAVQLSICSKSTDRPTLALGWAIW